MRDYFDVAIMSTDTFKIELSHISDKLKVDVMVIDEGHKAKNPKTKLRKALAGLDVTNQKIILTGTPIQNKLEEFWSVVDLVKPGIFLTEGHFKSYYGRPIELGMDRKATVYRKKRAMDKVKQMKALYGDHLLRRTKKQIFSVKCAETAENGIGPLELPYKTDIAVFIPLSDIQKRVYSLFLEDYANKEFRKEVEVNHIFPAILALKMLCVHPVLLLRKAFMKEDKEEMKSVN